MNGCPECDLDSGLYRDFQGLLQCDNCGWFDGKTVVEK